MEVRALSKEVAVVLCVVWVETRERMERREDRLRVGIDERRKRKSKTEAHETDTHPFSSNSSLNSKHLTSTFLFLS
jgi:hypothetical protein